MSFLNLSTGVVLAGLVALAGILFLLQRLRVKHRDLRVPTTLFWKEAVEEARARVLVRRFRHLPAYLLVLAIAALLWLATAAPRSTDDDGFDHVVLLDGSAGMARAERFDEAKEDLRRQVARLPRSHTTVRFCGSRPRTLLRPGEHQDLLERRLAGLLPEPCAATFEPELRSLLSVSRSRNLSVTVVGDAPIRDDTLALLPPGVEVGRATSMRLLGQNRGITSLGVAEAGSGAYQLVDLFVEVRGDGAETAVLALELDGEPRAAPAVAEMADGVQRVFVRDLPAQGQLLRVALTADGSPGGDGLPVDDAAVIALPERRRFRVELSPEVKAAEMADTLRALLRSDPAVILGERPVDLVVRRSGEAFGGAAPALELVPAGAQEHAILLIHDSASESADVLKGAIERLGLGEIDAMELAQVAARPISIGAMAGPQRTVRIWEELLTDRFDFARSRAFPMFAARTVRWLGDEKGFLPYAAAGESWPNSDGGWQDAAGIRLDPAGVGFTPPRAGVFRKAGAAAVGVALTDPAATAGPTQSDPIPVAATNGGTEFDPTSWLGIAALLLLAFEWFLYRTGRMP